MTFLDELHSFLSDVPLSDEQTNTLFKYALCRVQEKALVDSIGDAEILDLLPAHLLDGYIELLNRHIRRDLKDPMDEIEQCEAGVH